MQKAKPRLVHGDDLIYRFFNEALASEAELFERVPLLMIQSTAVWLPLDVYREWPILLPWVVRDPACRGNKAKGIPDEWGAPNAEGYMRDDNSMIKGLTRSLTINTPKASKLRGARMGREFVAAHVWREVKHDELATRLPILNSFVPNLVWLPAQVAKLSDQEGGIVQRTLQSIAYSLYRHAPVADGLREIVEEAWQLLPVPEQLDVTIEGFNTFESTDRFFSTRWDKLRAVLDALTALEQGESLTSKVITTRYGDGLPRVQVSARQELFEQLRQFGR